MKSASAYPCICCLALSADGVSLKHTHACPLHARAFGLQKMSTISPYWWNICHRLFRSSSLPTFSLMFRMYSVGFGGLSSAGLKCGSSLAAAATAGTAAAGGRGTSAESPIGWVRSSF